MTTAEKETTLKELETNLWETADSLRNESSLTSQMYFMPVLGIIFLRHATYRFRMVEKALVEDPTWPKRKGVPRPVVSDDFETKSAMFVPEKARYDYLLNLPGDQDICKAVNDAMTLIEDAKPILKGILPKTYSSLGPSLLRGLLRNFADEKIPRLGDDAFGRIYEYFLGCFAPQVASDDGVFFTPKSIVRLIVNFLEPTKGSIIDPACGSGGMFVSSGDFVADRGGNANLALKFYGQEKTDTNGKICLMNMAVHGFDAEHIRSGAAADGTEPVPPKRPKGWRQAKKDLLAKAAHAEALAKARDEIVAEQEWLVSKFGKTGKYKDVPGLCKSATRAEIAEKKFSLSPGAYVGVAQQKDDGVDFASRMKEIHAELLTRQAELGKIMKSIDSNLKELGL